MSEFFETRLEEDVLLSHGYAYKQAVRAMIDSTLPAKPEHNDNYILEFRSDCETKKFPLNPDGTIPGLFWIFFEEAFENWQSQITETTDYAELGSDTRFQRGGLKDNGVMIGEAGLVLVERAKFPGLPRRRGEKGATYEKDDAPIVEMAIEALLKGKSMAEVKAIYAPMMTGLAELPSKKARLASRIKVRLSSK